MDIRELTAIDVHAHYGKWDQGPETALIGEMMSGDAADSPGDLSGAGDGAPAEAAAAR